MEAPAGGVDDMTKLSYLHEPGVLQNLKTRYELNEIYVISLAFFTSYCFQTSELFLNFYRVSINNIVDCALFMADVHWKYSYRH